MKEAKRGRVAREERIAESGPQLSPSSFPSSFLVFLRPASFAPLPSCSPPSSSSPPPPPLLVRPPRAPDRNAGCSLGATLAAVSSCPPVPRPPPESNDGGWSNAHAHHEPCTTQRGAGRRGCGARRSNARGGDGEGERAGGARRARAGGALRVPPQRPEPGLPSLGRGRVHRRRVHRPRRHEVLLLRRLRRPRRCVRAELFAIQPARPPRRRARRRARRGTRTRKPAACGSQRARGGPREGEAVGGRPGRSGSR